jgi:hypothetical protein
MGLLRCFEAEDLLEYQLWDGSADASYNAYLITPPRIYAEEIRPTTGRPGALWGGADPNRWGPSSISFFAVTSQVRWPSWGAGRWKLDGRFGRKLERLSGATAFGQMGVTTGLLSVEPAGAVWEFAGHPFIDANGAVLMDVDTMTVTSQLIRPEDFAGHAAGAMVDFAVDRAADRVWIRWLTNNVGQVSVYRLSTRELLHEIWAPNQTNGVVLTHDGFVYVVDVLDWLCVYDYEGRLHGAMRHPRLVSHPGGVCYGWDAYYRRLLRLEGTPVAVDGASTLRVEAFYPVPQAALLSPPVPRQVPRAGRRVYVLSRAVGEGAEPIVGRAAQLGGDVAGAGSSDHQGDVVVAVTPAASGPLEVEVKIP